MGLESINSKIKAPNVFIDVTDGGGPSKKDSVVDIPKTIAPLGPTYLLESSAPIVSNFETFNVILSTANIPNGTRIPYTISNVTSNDINGASLTGNFTISNNTDSIPITLTGESYWLSIIQDAVGSICCTDTNKNVYMLSSYNTGASLIKYDPSGNIIWQKQLYYTYDFEVSNMSIDATGNIILGGFTVDPGMWNNVTTFIKCDGLGNIIWEKYLYDESYVGIYSGKIITDSNNNIYSIYNGDKRGIVKLDVDGNIVFQVDMSAIYPLSIIEITGITLDHNQDICVVAETTDFSANGLYTPTLFKFDSYGNLVWQKFIEPTLDMVPKGIVVDSANNIYVSGETWGMDQQTEQYFNDAFLIKTDAFGNAQWIKLYGIDNKYANSTCITIDSNDNIYVGGEITVDTYGCFLILQCDTNGNAIWQRYMGGISGNQTYSMCTDLDNNLYVTGWYSQQSYEEGSLSLTAKLKNTGEYVGSYSTDFGVVDYQNFNITTTDLSASSSNALFSINPSALIDNTELTITIGPSDKLNSTVIIGGSLTSITISLDNGQSSVTVPIVRKTYTLSSNTPEATPGETVVITLDTTGIPNNTNIPYTITGVTSADISGAPLIGNFTINNNTASKSYIMSPMPLDYWYSIITEYASPDCQFIKSVIDSSGNIISVGMRSSTGVQYDVISIVKYDSAGDILNQQEISTSAGCQASSVAIDKSNNIFISGLIFVTSVDLATDTRGFVIKISPDFTIQWSKVVSDTVQSNVSDLTIDQLGNIYLVGNKANPSLPSNDLFITKITNSGTNIWSNATEISTPSSECRGNGIAVDSVGYTYVTGYYIDSVNNPTKQESVIMKFDTLGYYMWQRIIPSIDNNNGKKILVNSNIYTIGSYFTTYGYYAAYISKITPDGLTVSNQIMLGNDWVENTGVDISQDSDGNIYAAITRGVENKIIIVKLNSMLQLLWKKSISIADHVDTANNILWNATDNTVIISGFKKNMYADYYRNFLLIKIPADGYVDGQYGNLYLQTSDISEINNLFNLNDLSLATFHNGITYEFYASSIIGSNNQMETYDLSTGYPTMLLSLDNGEDSVSVATRAFVPMSITIDSNIASYINLPFNGTYDITVDWGDQTIENFSTGYSVSHTYSTAGVYEILISGNATTYGITNNINSSITSVNTFGDLKFVSLNWAFHNATALISVPDNIPATVITMSHMFDGATNLMYGCDNWETGNVHDMSFMFKNATNFAGWLDRWDTHSTTTMAGMFFGAESFNQPINNWNVSNVTDFGMMFMQARSFNQYIGNWNVSSAQGFSYMFYGSSFNQYLDSWVMPQCRYIDFMFANTPFNNDSLNSWDISKVLYAGGMFANCPFDQNISSWNTSSIIAMEEMFAGNTAFNQPIGSWNVSNVSNMMGMFNGATSFNQDLSSWNTAYVSNMNDMFNGATSFIQNINSWNVSKISTYPGMFLNNNPMDPTVSSAYDANLPPAWGPYVPPDFA